MKHLVAEIRKGEYASLPRDRKMKRQYKLDENDVREIRKSSLSHRVLGIMHGVSKTTIIDVRNGTTWSHVI